MNSNIWNEAISKIINIRENVIRSQEQVDKTYSDFCSTLKKEMDQYLKIKDVSKKTRKSWVKHSTLNEFKNYYYLCIIWCVNICDYFVYFTVSPPFLFYLFGDGLSTD